MKTYLAIPLLLFFFVNIGISQNIDQTFFAEVDALLKKHVTNGKVDYGAIKKDALLGKLIRQASTADISGLDDNTIQAFYINAYNLNVINKVAEDYPIASVQEINGFFDKDKITVCNSKTTLNSLEKNQLLKAYKDPRYHFVLVCGALGCPPITDFAYTPDMLESQLDNQTRLALNDREFIRYSDSHNILQLSQIFKWYPKDFGSSKKQILDFVNQYAAEMFPESAKFKYYNYDWTLNGTEVGATTGGQVSSNQSRYIVSSTIPKGSVELKIFNNLYSQQTVSGGDERTDRSSFFTTSISAFYGLTSKFNIGLNTRFRKVRNNPLPSSPFTVFGSGDDGTSRSGLTAIGPQIRYAPVEAWENFSIQSSFVFPIGDELQGNNADLPFIDWNGATWNTQFFNDFSIGSKFSLFTEIDLLIEDIGNSDEHSNILSTPVTLIFSYVPTTKLTLYTIGGYSPMWTQDPYDYFYQYGVGTKYQFTPDVEIELLYTDFTNRGLRNDNGVAETINLGLRFNF